MNWATGSACKGSPDFSAKQILADAASLTCLRSRCRDTPQLVEALSRGRIDATMLCDDSAAAAAFIAPADRCAARDCSRFSLQICSSPSVPRFGRRHAGRHSVSGHERSPGVLHQHKGLACLSGTFAPAHSTCAPCNAQLCGRARPPDRCRQGRRCRWRPAAGAGIGKAAEDVRRQRLCRRGPTACWQPGCAAASAGVPGVGTGLWLRVASHSAGCRRCCCSGRCLGWRRGIGRDEQPPLPIL